jgi:hypothetical protein
MSTAVPQSDAGPGELPELTFDLARALGQFPEFEYVVSPSDLADYQRLAGVDPNPDGTLPPGFAAIFGRLGYLREHRMPPGGILLGQDIRWVTPAMADLPLRIGARVTSAEERDGKRTIVFLTTANQGGEVVAQVRITARWPK